MKARVAMLNAARLEKQRSTTTTTSRLSPESSGEASSAWTEPEEEGDCPENSDSSESDMEIEEEFTEERAQEIFDNFVMALPRDVRRMLAVILIELSRRGRKCKLFLLPSIMGYNKCTVRKYRDEFFLNKGELEKTKRGKYTRCCVYNDEEINHKAAVWVRENAFQKGAPNVTAYGFCEWVNNDLLPASHLPPQYPQDDFHQHGHQMVETPRIQAAEPKERCLH